MHICCAWIKEMYFVFRLHCDTLTSVIARSSPSFHLEAETPVKQALLLPPEKEAGMKLQPDRTMLSDLSGCCCEW